MLAMSKSICRHIWDAWRSGLSASCRLLVSRILKQSFLLTVHFAPWYRNPMFVEFDEELAPCLSSDKTGLQVQGTFMPETEIEKRYLNRPYGNAYDFSQQEPVEGVF